MPPTRPRARNAARSVAVRAAAAALALALPALAAAQPDAWEVDSGDVRVRCRMTLGGSFEAVTTALTGALGADAASGDTTFSGELRVDLATLDTDIGLRNNHLRERYLEVERGPAFQYAVLSGITIRGAPPADGARRETTFTARLALHGVEQAVEGEAELERRDGRMRVETEFALSIESFDIPPPRHLGIGVRDEITVRVAFDAASGGAR